MPHPVNLLPHFDRLAASAATDAALLARWREQREEAAFTALMARHGPMVLGVCRRLLGDTVGAEDVFQAVFLVLARQASRLRRPEALAGFLHTIAVRLARKARVAAHRRQRVQAPLDAAEPLDPRPHPLDLLSGRELLALLDEEIARLPEVNRLPLLLCLMQGRTIEEAARLLGWSVGSLRGRLTRGRERLRQRLRRRGLDLSAGVVALLTPAAMPEHLRAACVRNLTAPAGPAVHTLTAGSTAALKLKAVGLALFLTVALGLGAGLTLLRAPETETPAAAPPAAPPMQAKDEPRRDRYGDPLPPGAMVRLGTLRFRAPGEIVAMTFAPDGKTLAISSRGGLYLFDAPSGKRLRHLPSASPDWTPEELLAFSPDGKRLAGRGHKIVSQSVLPVVRVWELDGERRTQEYDIGQWILWLGWTAKNEPLAIRAEDNGALHLHDLAAGRSRRFACKEPLKYPSGFISRDPPVSCSPAAQTLAVVDNKNTIHIWDITTGRERCTLQPKGDSPHSLTFSPDGSWLLSKTSKTVQMWDVAAAKALYTVDAAMLYGPVFSADGKTLAILDSSETVRFWDAATGRERRHTEGKGDYAASIALSADGKWLAASTRSGSTFHVWDTATGKRKPQPEGHTNRPWSTAFSPDGRRVVTGGSMDGTFRVWDTRTGEPLRRIKQPGMARECALSVDGRTLFASWSSGGLEIFDAATGDRRHVLPLNDPDRPDTYQSIMSTHLPNDGKTLVAFSYYYTKKQAGPRYEDTLITGFDASTHKQLFQRRRPGMDSWIALSGDARVLAVPHHDRGTRIRERTPGKGPMRLEDLRSGELLLTFPALKGQTWPLAFSPDGRLLASNNYYRPEPGKDGKPSPATNTLRLWETVTASEALSLPAADFDRIGFSRDGRLLALSAPAQEIVVWDLRRGREHRRFKGFDAEVIGLAFSPDGRRLVSGLADSTLLVWDVGTDDGQDGKLGAEGLVKAWADLAGADAPRAFRARGMLASAPEETISFLKEHLHPARSADPEQLRRLLADLGSEEFTVREKAQAELAELGDLAEPALRQTLADKPTLEVRRRVQALLDRLRGPVKRPETLRSLRAVAVLEDIGTPAARRLLEEQAKGTDGARLTREANESLRRLTSR